MLTIDKKFEYAKNLQQKSFKPSNSSFINTNKAVNTSKPAITYVKPSINNLKAYIPSFTSNNDVNIDDFSEDIVKKVKGKQYSGIGIYKKAPNGKYTDYIDWENKIGWDKLKNEPIDWKNATNNEIYAFWHALALAETNDTTWSRRFNPINRKAPLAVDRTLSLPSARANHQEKLRELNRISLKEAPFLNLPIVNPETGKLNFSFTVFDTETTGINTVAKRPVIPGDDDEELAAVDKIIQIGAVKFDEKGNIIARSALSQLVNPEMPIPEESTEVHGITDQDVADKPVMNQILKDFSQKYLKNDLLVAYNSKFDIALYNNAVDDYNKYFTNTLKHKKECITLDPFILIQRIHPYLGSKKQLSEQYKFLFGQNIDDAHDAFADVKATADVLKYCLYYLDNLAKKNGKVLTVKDVLKFQFGEPVENMGITLDKGGCNAAKSYKQSYKKYIIGVDKFLDGYCITEPTRQRKDLPDKISELRPLIGDKNIQILRDSELINHNISNFEDGVFIEPQETVRKSNKKMVNARYVMENNFKTVLLNIGIQGYKDKSRDEIIDLITEHAKHYRNEDFIGVWMKTANPENISRGNDLPDIDIARKVMLERIESDEQNPDMQAKELNEVIKNLEQ